MNYDGYALQGIEQWYSNRQALRVVHARPQLRVSDAAMARTLRKNSYRLMLRARARRGDIAAMPYIERYQLPEDERPIRESVLRVRLNRATLESFVGRGDLEPSLACYCRTLACWLAHRYPGCGVSVSFASDLSGALLRVEMAPLDPLAQPASPAPDLRDPRDQVENEVSAFASTLASSCDWLVT